MRAAKGIAENGRFDAFADLPTMEDITAAFSPEARAAPAVSESVSSDFKGLRRHSRVVCEIALPPRGPVSRGEAPSRWAEHCGRGSALAMFGLKQTELYYPSMLSKLSEKESWKWGRP